MGYMTKEQLKLVIHEIITGRLAPHLLPSKFDTDYFVDNYNEVFNKVIENKTYPHKRCLCGYTSLRESREDCPICNTPSVYETSTLLSDYIMLSPDISDFVELYRRQWLMEKTRIR